MHAHSNKSGKQKMVTKIRLPSIYIWHIPFQIPYMCVLFLKKNEIILFILLHKPFH